MIDRLRGLSRRAFMTQGARAAAGAVAGALVSPELLSAMDGDAGAKPRFGLVTYQWGRDWDLPTLLRNCQRAGAEGVELRVEHAHAVEPSLGPRERQEVRLRFQNNPVELVGFGTNWAFHYEDADRVRREMEGAREHVRLSHDVGGSGVKVKPDGLPAGVPVERTLEQIGRSLDELGRFAADHGQEIRVEVHGAGTRELPIIRRIFDRVEQPNVRVCWNSNPQDLDGEGLAHNFDLVRDHFGRTAHVHELDSEEYPYQQLIDLLVATGYDGWILMEAGTEPMDRVRALARQRAHFDGMVAGAQARARGS